MPTPIWHFALGIAEKPANVCQNESGTLAGPDLQLKAEAGSPFGDQADQWIHAIITR